MNVMMASRSWSFNSKRPIFSCSSKGLRVGNFVVEAAWHPQFLPNESFATMGQQGIVEETGCV